MFRIRVSDDLLTNCSPTYYRDTKTPYIHMVYFVKTTPNGIIVADKTIGKKSVTLPNGAVQEVNTQGGMLGFVAWKDAEIELADIEKGTKLPFSITDKPVTTKKKEPIPNLYWCNPD